MICDQHATVRFLPRCAEVSESLRPTPPLSPSHEARGPAIASNITSSQERSMVPNSLVLQHSYRHLGPSEQLAAQRHLIAAADALNMALLTLDGSPDDGRDAKHARAASARHFLAEAVIGLARARVYVPGVRTYAVNVVTTTEPDLDRELARLHELTSKLIWRNHSVLPGRNHAQPLAPED
jgi:hypothetical protein